MTSITGQHEAEAIQMAYVGSPSDLVKQPGTSTSSSPAGLWKPLLAMIVAAAIVVMAVMAIGSLVGSKQVAPVGFEPRSGREPAVVSPAGRSQPRADRKPAAVGRPGWSQPRPDREPAAVGLAGRTQPGADREPPAVGRADRSEQHADRERSAGCQPHGFSDRPAPQAHPHASVTVVRTTTEGSIDSRRLNAH